MVFITEDIVRKRSEHNNLEITTLEELSLHQLDIEKIDHLDKWCRDLKILYLQSNLIPKIENVKRLKKLEYLNLALNNIKRIENLGGCESLNKLDLTVNFVGELTSIESLKDNIHLRELFLTGNPCVEFVGYREYVIATLPNLKYLDGQEIEKSERILAVQKYYGIRDGILQQQKMYFEKEAKRLAEKDKSKQSSDGKWYTDINEQEKKTEENKAEEKESFWDQPSEFTPESRMELYKHMEEEKRKREEENNKRLDRSIPERQIRLFNDDGKPLNVNQAKIGFKLVESIDNCSFELEVSCYKHMDTSQVELDVQPWYVRVTIKEKILQLVFSEEVSPDKCTAKRSQTTGHLIVNIPKLKQIIMAKTRKTGASHNKPNEANGDVGKSEKSNVLESCDQKSTFADMLSIVQNESHESKDSLEREKESQKNVPNKSDLQSLSEDFVDDPDVPPLI